MTTPDLTAEDERLATLRSYEVLDTAPEDAFDALVRAAASVCGAPMAAVSLVDGARQWFKARVGLDVAETPRSVSFCDHAMREDTLLVVPDAARDPRFSDNALVTGGPHIRFYAGAGIHAPDGSALGALCVLDTVERPQGLMPLQAQMLRVLADQVEPQLRLRLAALQQGEAAASARAARQAVLQREGRLLGALEAADVGWWDWDIDADVMFGNAEMAAAYGLDTGTGAEGVAVTSLLSAMAPESRTVLRGVLQDALATHGPYRHEYRRIGADGGVRWISARGRCLRDPAGRPVRFSGVAVDITERRRMEDRLRDADIARELTLEAAHLGRFDHDLVDGVRFYDARARAMLSLTPEQAQDVELFFARIHPDDRQRVIDAQAAGRNPERRGHYREVYRVIDPGSGAERWISGVGRTVFNNGMCTRFMGVLEDVTDARRADTHRTLLVNELNHRVKNSLALVHSLVDASLRGATDLAGARADVGRRIQALSRAHDLLTAQNWSAAAVGDIVAGVAADLSLPPERLEVEGGAILLGPKPALHLTLALHELATNALKYGALKTATGVVRLHWGLREQDGVETFGFDWVERGGPPVAPPTRRGFGSRLVERITAAEFDGEVLLAYAPEGVGWRLRAPYAGLAERGRSEPVIAE